MDYTRLLFALVLCGCPAEGGEPGDTDGDTEAVATSDGHLCHPGTSTACACSDGAMGTQLCAADGQSYGECECGDGESSASTSTTDDPTTDASTDPTVETSTGESSGSGSEASTSGESTGAACDDGEVMACECGEGPGFATCTGGVLGACECCMGMGSHPLVEGDMRYCEAGDCYCGDLQLEPPLDVCYAEAIADACCPIDLVCY